MSHHPRKGLLGSLLSLHCQKKRAIVNITLTIDLLQPSTKAHIYIKSFMFMSNKIRKSIYFTAPRKSVATITFAIIFTKKLCHCKQSLNYNSANKHIYKIYTFLWNKKRHSFAFVKDALRIIYIGNICWWKCQRQLHVSLLYLATLGDATQIGSFLLLSCRPRWPRQVQLCLCHVSLSPALSHHLCQCKHRFNHKSVTTVNKGTHFYEKLYIFVKQNMKWIKKIIF